MSKSVPGPGAGSGSGDKLLSYCLFSLFLVLTLFFCGSTWFFSFFHFLRYISISLLHFFILFSFCHIINLIDFFLFFYNAIITCISMHIYFGRFWEGCCINISNFPNIVLWTSRTFFALLCFALFYFIFAFWLEVSSLIKSFLSWFYVFLQLSTSLFVFVYALIWFVYILLYQ